MDKRPDFSKVVEAMSDDDLYATPPKQDVDLRQMSISEQIQANKKARRSIQLKHGKFRKPNRNKRFEHLRYHNTLRALCLGGEELFLERYGRRPGMTLEETRASNEAIWGIRQPKFKSPEDSDPPTNPDLFEETSSENTDGGN